MQHGGALPTYQIHDHPTYRGGATLKELQPPMRAGEDLRDTAAPGNNFYLGRGLDQVANLASVGDKAPTRGPAEKQDAPDTSTWRRSRAPEVSVGKALLSEALMPAAC